MSARTVTVTADFTPNIIEATATISDRVLEVDAGLTTIIKHSEMPAYTGVTEITPSDEIQTLQTASMALYDNITINPIPSNYGKITWNGSTLTVS